MVRGILFMNRWSWLLYVLVPRSKNQPVPCNKCLQTHSGRSKPPDRSCDSAQLALKRAPLIFLVVKTRAETIRFSPFFPLSICFIFYKWRPQQTADPCVHNFWKTYEFLQNLFETFKRSLWILKRRSISKWDTSLWWIQTNEILTKTFQIYKYLPIFFHTFSTLVHARWSKV